MKKLKQNKLLVIAWALVLAFFAYFILFNNSIFMFEGDMLSQLFRFYEQIWSQIRNDGISFWNWSSILGANLYGSSTYYGLTSPYFYIIMLAPNVESIIPFILLSNIAKSLVCVTGCYLWVKKLYNNDVSSFVCSIMLTFSGYVLTNYNNDVMLAAISFMPFALYYTEKFLEDNDKFLGLIISVSLIIFANYYYAYIFIPFLCIYALVRYIVINKVNINIYKVGFKYLGCIIVALLISMVILLPSFMALSGNPRTTDLPYFFSFIDKYDLFRFVSGFFNPINDWRLNNNYFINTIVDEGIGYSGGMAVYCFIITPLCIYLLPWIKKNNQKLSIIFLYCLYGMFVIMPFFYVLFNQSLESRWMLNINFINVMCVGYVLANLKQVSKKQFIISFVLIIATMIGLLFITKHFNLSPEPWGLKIVERNIIILLMILGGYLLYCYKPKQILIVILVIGELLLSFYNIFFNDGNKLDPMTIEELNDYNLYDSSTYDYLKKVDDSYYRVDFESYEDLSENDSNSFGYHSFIGYTSTYNFNQQDFNTNRFKLNYMMYFYPQPSKWLLKSILSNKYFIKRNEYEHVPYGYSYLNKINDDEIYLNNYPISFAYLQNNWINKAEFDEYEILKQDYLLLNNVILENVESSISNDVNLELWMKDVSNATMIDVSNLDGGYLYLTFDGYQNIGYSTKGVDGTEIDFGFYTRDLSYVSIPLIKGATHIYLTMDSPVDIYYDNLRWYDDWYNNLQMAYDVGVGKDYIEGKIDVDSTSYCSTTIPYDLGWKVFVDNNEVEILKVNNGFVGFKLEKGNHHIVMKYISPGFKIGLSISIISIIGLILLVVYRRWKNEVNKKD